MKGWDEAAHKQNVAWLGHVARQGGKWPAIAFRAWGLAQAQIAIWLRGCAGTSLHQHITAEPRLHDYVQNQESRHGEHDMTLIDVASGRADWASICDAYVADMAEQSATFAQIRCSTDGEM